MNYTTQVKVIPGNRCIITMQPNTQALILEFAHHKFNEDAITSYYDNAVKAKLRDHMMIAQWLNKDKYPYEALVRLQAID